MEIAFERLLEILDASGVPNQGVPATQALVIAFGPGDRGCEPVVYDSVSDVSMHLDIDGGGRVLSVEFY